LLIAYFLGSFPTAFIAGKLKGIDISKEGNKNVGASNTFFLLGKIAGSIVLLIDVGKGYFAVWFASKFSDQHPFIPFLAIVLTVIGHSWMFPIGFKGGKGTAALVGALIYLAPFSIPVLFILFIPVATFLLKDSFLGVGIAMFFFAFLMWGWKGDYLWLIFILLLTLIYSLRCLGLYISYFRDQRRYINPLVGFLLRPFMKKR